MSAGLLRPTVLAVLASAIAAVASGHDAADQRLRRLTRAAESRPRDPAPRLARVEVLVELGRWDEAIAECRTVAEHEPAAGATCEAATALARGDAGTTRRLMDALLADRPDDFEARVLRGRALVLMEAWQEAVADLAVATRSVSHPSPTLFLELSRALVAAGGENRVEALAVLEEGLQRLGAAVVLEREALGLEVSLGRTGAALRRLDRLAAGSRRPERWLLVRGNLLRDLGRTEEARAVLLRGLELLSTRSEELQSSPGAVVVGEGLRAALAELGSSRP